MPKEMRGGETEESEEEEEEAEEAEEEEAEGWLVFVASAAM
jgi:hypothetical protein